MFGGDKLSWLNWENFPYAVGDLTCGVIVQGFNDLDEAEQFANEKVKKTKHRMIVIDTTAALG